jgi:putative ABC transport system permease protein
MHFWLLQLFALFVMLLPTLNLVNVNITRIMERSSEIGVRKAFGASSRTLVYQFIVENLILTFLGGFIGMVLSRSGDVLH